MISLLEKLKEQQNFKEFNIDSLKDATVISASVADIMNQYYKENDMIYKFIYKVYDVNGEPHLFIKNENKTNLNDSPCDNRYGMDNWVRGLYKLKDKFSDYLLDNLFGFCAKWNFIDKSSRINNLGKTAYGFYTTFNGMLFNSSKESNIIGPVKAFDKRTLAGKRRKLAQTKAPEAMLTLLDTAVSAGLSAEYVLFDSWFSNPAQITAIKRKGMDVIAMIKKSSRIKYTYNDEQLNIKEIYSKNKKRRGRSKYLLSVDVIVGKENPIPAKIVCVRNKANRKDWLAFICTDTSLSEEEIIRIYGKRWQIEVFFKTCKSMLNLIGECHSLSYDALTAHVAIVFTRYMLLATEQRQNEDQRTLGELFFFLVDEMADITFSRSLGILMDALMASLQEILKLSDEQLSALIADFESRLPEYLRNALHPGTAMA